MTRIYFIPTHPHTHSHTHTRTPFSHNSLIIYYTYSSIYLSIITLRAGRDNVWHHLEYSYSSECRGILKRNNAIQWRDTNVINFNASKTFSFHLPGRPVHIILLHIIEGMMARTEGALINVCFANGQQKSLNQHNEEIQVAINSVIFVTIK